MRKTRLFQLDPKSAAIIQTLASAFREDEDKAVQASIDHMRIEHTRKPVEPPTPEELTHWERRDRKLARK